VNGHSGSWPDVASGTAGSVIRAADGDPLRRCIAVPVEEFSDRYWSREPLYSPASQRRGDFADLFSEAAADELVSRRGLRTPFARMVKQGSELNSVSYTRAGGVGATIADQVADDKVLAQLADGASLVLQGLHRTWPPLIEFGSDLAAQLGHPVQINAYVTPSQNQGFSAHYDTHDVFVLQISGRKRWLIHRPVLIDPLPEQTWQQHREAVMARAAEAPLLEVTLEPGDALYLPRGYLHSATALGELSIHLTVGVHPINRYSLIRQLLASAAAEPELRRSLPLGLDLADPSVLAPELRHAARLLTNLVAEPDNVQVAAVAARIGSELTRTTRPAPIAPLQQLRSLAGLTAETPVRVRRGLRIDVREGAEGVRLQLLDRGISLPQSMAAALKLPLSGQVFTPAELPGLDGGEQLDLVARLLREAVLVPAGSA
jgi:lysine-specific demethylase/histidyl-hydroxylase NO66